MLATRKHQLPPRFNQDSNSCQDPAQDKNQPCRGSDEMHVHSNARHQQPLGSADAGALHATGPGGAPGQSSGSSSSRILQAVDRAAAEAFLDADLSILAAPRERYLQYSQAIRLEYQHLSDEQFRCACGGVHLALRSRTAHGAVASMTREPKRRSQPSCFAMAALENAVQCFCINSKLFHLNARPGRAWVLQGWSHCRPGAHAVPTKPVLL